MDNLSNTIAYFEDLATRHPLIRHTEAKQRFFDLEWDDMIENGAKLAGTGWNVVLEDFREQMYVDKGEDEQVIQTIAVMVLKGVPRGKRADMKQAYLDARAICRTFLAKMRREHFNNCEPDLPAGVEPPAWVDLNKVMFARVSPRFTGFDHSSGIRMVVQWRTRDEKRLDEDTVEFDELP